MSHVLLPEMLKADSNLLSGLKHNMMGNQENYALQVLNASKSYQKGKYVLKDLNMKIVKGTIYGLMGPSGCGKTTLLHCILGLTNLDYGEIKSTYSKKTQVGFMPQDLCLNDGLSIIETFHYFFCVFNIKDNDRELKIEELSKALRLPPLDSVINTLSGGEQRRVSLAVSLLHEPDLFVLDEPTVGVDPMLRESIWQLLLKMTSQHHKTIIITTHYIEEVRTANSVGFMRKGKIVIEENPENVLTEFGCNTLEEAFVKICYSQNENKSKNEDPLNDKKKAPLSPFKKDQSTFQSNRFSAELKKNFYVMKKHLEIFSFMIGVVVASILGHWVAYGRMPDDLKVGLVNDEFGSSWNNCLQVENLIYAENDLCKTQLLSCKYIKHLARQSVRLENFDNINDGIESIKRNHVWAVLQFPKNFTGQLMERLDLGIYATKDVIENGVVQIYRDNSDMVISQLLHDKFAKAMQSSISETFTECKWNKHFVDSPLNFNKPIYGRDDYSYENFATPGVLFMLIFMFPQAYIMFITLDEKKSKFADRAMVAGVSLFEIMFGHFVMECFILTCQTVAAIVTRFYILGAPFGQPLISTSLVILCGICGASQGIMLAALNGNISAATGMEVGMFMSIGILGGSFWATEGLHQVLKIIATFFVPVCPAIESFRSSTMRSWGLEHFKVYIGFVSLFSWTLIYFALTVLIFKLKGGRFSS